MSSRKKFLRRTAALVTAGAMTHAAFAAQGEAVLRQLQGSVLLNHATGFSTAAANMQLHAGDRVLTLDNSRATVIWPDGCIAQLDENSIFTFQTLSPCRGGKDMRKRVGAIFARAIGSDIITDVPPSDSKPSTASEPPPQPASPAPPEQPIPAEPAAGAGGVVGSAGAGGFSAFQTVVTGVAIGAGLAVVVQAGASDSGNGAVSPE